VVAADVGLDASGEVLQGDERGLAHDPLEHDAPGDAHFDRQGGELVAVFFLVEIVDLAGGTRVRLPV
jgi:hypothetical protein